MKKGKFNIAENNLVDEKLKELEEPNDEIIVVKTFKDIKEMMNDMNKIIKELKVWKMKQLLKN